MTIQRPGPVAVLLAMLHSALPARLVANHNRTLLRG